MNNYKLYAKIKQSADLNFAMSKDETLKEDERKIAGRVAAALYEILRWIEE